MAVDVAGLVSIAILAVLVLGPLAWAARHYAVLADLRTARQVFRLELPAIAVGLIALGGAGAAVVVFWTPAAPFTMVFAATLLGLAALALPIAAANLDWYRASQRLPVTDPADVTPGPVQTAGRAVPTGDLVPASVTKTESVAYRASTREERALLGRGYAGSTWAAVSVAHDAAPFGLIGEPTPASGGETAADEDPDASAPDRGAEGRALPAHLRTELEGPDDSLADMTADVHVDGTAAEYPLLAPTSSLINASPAAGELDGLERIVPAEPGITVPVKDDLARGARPRPREYAERRIDPGDPVYVIGTARETASGDLEIVDDPDGPPLIVLRTDADLARKHARRFAVAYGLFGLFAYVGGLVLLASVGL